jgi:DNA-binding NarL/FixJ family response regulator
MTPPPRPARVLVVDDHRLLAHSVAIALRAEGMHVDVADLTSAAPLVAAADASPPDLVLLDLELGGAIGSGIDLVRPLGCTGARVLVVSAATDRSLLAAAVEQGAVGVVAKAAGLDVLLDTARAVLRGEQVLTGDERQRLLRELASARRQAAAARAPFERLTRREEQVLHALGQGMSVGSIAAQWFVSEATVRSQVRGILTKLDVGSQLEAVVSATRAGWQPSTA